MQGSKNDWLLVRTSGIKKNIYEQFYYFAKRPVEISSKWDKNIYLENHKPQ